MGSNIISDDIDFKEAITRVKNTCGMIKASIQQY